MTEVWHVWEGGEAQDRGLPAHIHIWPDGGFSNVLIKIPDYKNVTISQIKTYVPAAVAPASSHKEQAHVQVRHSQGGDCMGSFCPF